MELIQSPHPPPKKKIYVRLIQDDVQGFAPIGWICRREKYLVIYDVEGFFLLWISSMEVLVILVRIRI